MLFMIVGTDVENSLQKRTQARPAHLERLTQLQAQGRLLIAGPNPAIESEDPGEAGFSGSLIVAEFASQDEAERWAAADPYMEAGVYSHVDIKPFKKVFPA